MHCPRLLWAGRVAVLLALLVPEARAFAPVPTQTIAATGSVEVAFSPLNDPEEALLQAIEDARERIYVQAYLFTSKPLARGLIAAHQRGVRVEVLLDAEANRPGSPGVLGELLAAGIPVAAETRYNIAHNKLMIFDPATAHAAVATGSYNYTRSAKVANAENLLILRGNRALVQAFLENWQRHRAEALELKAAGDVPAR